MEKNAHYIELLRNEVKTTFSSEYLTIKLTVELSDDIFNKTGKKLSPSTLQRFFELITNTSYPSKATLNILAEYVHYSSWDDFIQKHNVQLNHNIHNRVIVDSFGLSLFNICLKNHDFASVLEYIDKLPPIEHISEDIHRKIAATLGVFLRKSQKGRTILLPELAKSVNGRLYFFEKFTDLDYLNYYFSDALDIYKKYTTAFDKNRQFQDLIYANSVQYVNQLRTNQKRAAIKNATIIHDILPIEEVAIDTLNHIFPVARYYYTHLTYLQLTKQLHPQKVEIVLNQVITTIDNKSLNSRDLIILLGVVCEALLFCQCYQEVCYLYQRYKKGIETGYKGAFAYIPLMSAVTKSYEQLQKTAELKTSYTLPKIQYWGVNDYQLMHQQFKNIKLTLDLQ